jgi:hypothetical protein
VNRNLRRCPNCDVAMRESKENAVLLSQRQTSGQVWIQVAPPNIGLTVRPFSCPLCGLVLLYQNRRRTRASRVPRGSWPRRPRQVPRRAVVN